MFRKPLSAAELQDIANNLWDPDDESTEVGSIESDYKIEDHLSEASEEDDQQVVLSDNEEEYVATSSRISDCVIFETKDGINWKSQPQPTGRMRSCNIIKSKVDKVMLAPGQSVDDPVDFFCLFVDKKIVNEIVKCTNKEAEKVLGIENWKYCDYTELYVFIGLLLTSGRSNSRGRPHTIVAPFFNLDNLNLT
uniref:Uncharacterized protein LOC114337472 n=1 Tax=Diabrotica virgifera virgifera TaxID=50390 RepID=A0A6P7G3Z6_DIAVI